MRGQSGRFGCSPTAEVRRRRLRARLRSSALARRRRCPTSHILKPSAAIYPGQAVSEHLALATARGLGIDAARTEVAVIGGVETLVVQRYDRVRRRADPESLARAHQVDMCQALGRPAVLRFQRDGGPSPADIAGLLRTHSSDPAADVAALVRRLVYCWVIVANDAHAKNHALVHLPGGVCRLAPLYDTASWLRYTDVAAHDVHLAMTLGAGYQVGTGPRITARTRGGIVTVVSYFRVALIVRIHYAVLRASNHE